MSKSAQTPQLKHQSSMQSSANPDNDMGSYSAEYDKEESMSKDSSSKILGQRAKRDIAELESEARAEIADDLIRKNSTNSDLPPIDER